LPLGHGAAVRYADSPKGPAAMVYRPCSPPSATSPTPTWRASAVGVYRLWRDGGFAIGTLLAGIIAGLLGRAAAIWAAAALTALSRLVVAVRMYEIHHRNPATASGLGAPASSGTHPRPRQPSP